MHRMKTALITILLCAGLGASWLATSQTDGSLEAKSAASPTASPANDSTTGYNRLIVKFKEETAAKTDQTAGGQVDPQTRINTFNARGGMQVLGQKAVTLSYLKSVSEQAHVVQTDQPLSRAEMKALTQQLAQDARVEYAEIDEKVFAHFAPNDPGYVASQWAWKSSGSNAGATNTDSAWNKSTGGQPVSGAGVVVAVLDTGYVTHADLTANLLLTGYDFVSADTLPYSPFSTANDGNGRDSDAADPGNWNTNTGNGCSVSDSGWHGTRVAGIVSAVGNNSTGMIGIAYGAKVLPVRVLGVCGGYVSDIAAGMRWAAGILSISGVFNPNVAKILNLSLGSSGTCLSTFQDAVNDVRAAGSIVVASTGNDGSITTISQPANCQGVIAVTAHMLTGDSPSFANDGPGTTISAPGVSIYGTLNSGTTTPVASPGGDTYVAANGTSFAAPMVSGVAALLLQIKPTMGINELTSRLVDSVRAFPSGTYCFNKTSCGAGMLDADAATALVLADTAPTTTATANKTDPVARSTLVTLTGTATAGANGTGISTVGWTQVSGPTVTLSGANTSTATFTTPATSDTVGMTFRFQATSISSGSSSSMVSINMVSAPNPVTSSGGGGGGGSLDWADITALLFMALTGLALRRLPATQKQGR
ncbi:S8 family serine peptidase [Rhodoferax saidenbachensis]|nr:S8 family serine peptidase [Rhodoferax saidenbachensis]